MADTGGTRSSGLVQGSPPDSSNFIPDNSGGTPAFGFPPNPGLQQIGGGTLQVLPALQPPRTPIVVQSSPYWEYAISKIIFEESGLAVNPIAGPIGTPADVVRETAPWGWMILRWRSSRRGALPIVPSKILGDPNAIFIRGWRGFAVPGYLISGRPCFQVEGEYLYSLRIPYQESDPVLIGAMPYSSDSPNAYQMTQAQYSQNIVGPNLPPAGAPGLPITF